MSNEAAVADGADETGAYSVVYETDGARRVLLLEAARCEDVEAWTSNLFNIVLRCDRKKAESITAYALRMWRDYEALRLRCLASVLEERHLEVPEHILDRVDWLQDEDVEVEWPFRFSVEQIRL